MTVGTTTHISLAGHEYMVKPYSYIRRRAPDFGPRFSTGDPDFNNLSMWQHWAQSCFIGGVGQEKFQDDAMYDEGVGLNTSDHEKVTLSRDLARGSGSNWTISSGTTAASLGYKFCVYNGKLYVLTMGSATSKIWEYDPSTDGWTDRTGSSSIIGRSITTFDGKIWVGGQNSGGTASRLIYSSGSTLATWTSITVPSGATAYITALKAFQQRLYACYAASIYRYKENAAGSGYEQDGTTAFYKGTQNSETNSIIALEVHLGFLYGLSNNGHVHRSDGNSTFDIWNWDGQTQGTAIRSFDGRLFITTFEYTNTTNVGYGAIYQMSGSAVTQLKRFGNNSSSQIIGNMVVWDRKLFYGASNLFEFGARPGFGVAVYDPIEDAHSIFAENSDTVTYSRGSSPYDNYIVDDQIFFGGNLFVAVRGHGAFKTPHRPRDIVTGVSRHDISAAGGSLASKNGGWLATSTYDAGTPGVKKLWRKIVVDASIATNTGILPEYSIDDGATWTALAGITTVANRYRTEYFLNNKISTSIKLRFTLRSTVNTATPTLWGFVVSYMPVPEPNWMWTFTIVLAGTIEAVNGTTLTYNPVTEMAFLEDTWRAKQLVTYIDVDGTSWGTNGPGVLIYDYECRVGQMSQPLEGEVIITLLEAVETY